VGRAGSNLAELRVRVLTAGGQVEAVVLAVQLRLDLLLFQEPPVLQELIVSELLLVLSLLEIEGGCRAPAVSAGGKRFGRFAVAPGVVGRKFAGASTTAVVV
jgi:hypothetical protein